MTIKTLYPNVRPTLDLAFAATKALDPRITFTRASAGTYVGSDGTLRTAGVNEARFDHAPLTLESLGLLVEEARTNLLLRSEEFQTTWSPLNITVSTDTSISPTGSLTADTITPAASTAAHLISQTATVVASTPCTASVYIKNDGAPFVQVVYDNGASVGAFINVNTSTGAITRGPELAGVATNATGSVVSVGNGWYRVNVGATHTGTIGRILISPLPAASSAASVNPSTTTAATDKVLLWGAQLEAGAFATSYIPTTTATVTRAADVASITGSNFSSWYRQDEGTVFADAKEYPFASLVARSFYAFVSSATPNNNFIRQWIWNGNTSLLLNSVYTSSSGPVAAELSQSLVNEQKMTALAYKINDFARSYKGNAALSDVSGNLPVAIDELGIGNSSQSQYLSGHIRRLTYWPWRLSNATLQALTS